MQKVDQKFVWFEVRNSLSPNNGAYSKGNKYQFETAHAAQMFIDEMITKGSNYKQEDFQIVKHTETNKTV